MFRTGLVLPKGCRHMVASLSPAVHHQSLQDIANLGAAYGISDCLWCTLHSRTINMRTCRRRSLPRCLRLGGGPAGRLQRLIIRASSLLRCRRLALLAQSLRRSCTLRRTLLSRRSFSAPVS